MFESLSDKLDRAFASFRGQKTLRAEDVDAAAREIRVALLEADVALPVVKQFIADIKDKAVGQSLIKSVRPDQQIVKIVHDALIDTLGGAKDTEDGGMSGHDLAIDVPAPSAWLVMGLQGSGKTTSTAKIAYLLKNRFGKKILMASLDIYRPAAQEQLRVLGEQTGIDTLSIIEGQAPVDIARRAMEEGRKGGYDLVFLDSAGRLAIDERLMAELEQVRDLVRPVESLLVADAMTGQDAVNTAATFNDRIGVTGIMLTRIDGDARGGAAMSMKGVTGKPVKLLGTGEKYTEIEIFHPERIAGRILGMGDVVGLVERAAETVDQEEAAKMAEKFKKGQFDLDDFAKQLKQLRSMGGLGAMMKMLPGLGKMSGMMAQAGMDETVIKKQEAMLSSMTRQERGRPEILNASRKRRIAAGSGTSVQDINKLLKQFAQMQKMMKSMRKMGMGNMMKTMKGMMGGNPQMDDMMAQMEREMGGPAGDSGSPLGPNPFLGGGTPPSFPPGLMGPGMSGGGLPQSRFTKSRKSKRKKK